MSLFLITLKKKTPVRKFVLYTCNVQMRTLHIIICVGTFFLSFSYKQPKGTCSQRTPLTVSKIVPSSNFSLTLLSHYPVLFSVYNSFLCEMIYLVFSFSVCCIIRIWVLLREWLYWSYFTSSLQNAEIWEISIHIYCKIK